MKKGTYYHSNQWKVRLTVSCYRVAVTPIVAGTFVKKGFTVNVEENAGFEAKFRNEDYLNVGAKVVNTQNAFNSGKFLIVIRKYMIYYTCYSLQILCLKCDSH